MKKLFLTLLLSILALTSFAPSAYAKVWTKELVDKVTLESGYKFSICTIDMPYDRTNSADNIFNAAEKDFEANPDAFPCNKQSQEDVLFADITLYFNKAKWNDVSAPEKLIEFQNHLYSVDEYGDVLSDPNGNTDIKDIAAFDWFSTIPTINGIRGTRLINTDPNATDDQKTLPNSNFLIIHDPATGKFSAALFVFNNTVYKFSSMISQVTTPTTLIDYTQTDNATPTMTLTATPDPTETWKTYTNTKYGFSFKYPAELNPNETNEVNPSDTSGDPRKLLVNLDSDSTTQYSAEVLDSTENGGMFINSWYTNIEDGPSNIQKDEINGQTAYKFFMAKAGINGGSGNILFQKGTTIVTLSTAVKNGTAENILNDDTLNRITNFFKFTQ
jgi:hypothetical protein